MLGQPPQPQTSPRIAETRAKLKDLIASADRVRHPGEAAISPNGKFVAWTVAAESGNPNAGTTLNVSSLPDTGQPPIKINTDSGDTHCHASSLTWSPDNQSIAFLRECGDTNHITLAPILARMTPRDLASPKGYLSTLRFAPNGESLAFLYVENATRHSGALAAMKPPSGVIGVEGLEVQRIGTIPVAGGDIAQITPPNLHVYEYSWSPDSQQVVYTAAAPPGENNWWVAQLYTQSASADAQPRSILAPGYQMAVPRFSPDGKQIALIGGLMSDQGSTGGDIYLVPASGGEAKNITSGRTTTPQWLQWMDDSALAVSEVNGGFTRLNLLDTATGSDRHSFDVQGTVRANGEEGSISLSSPGPALNASDLRIAYVFSSFEKPPEVWAGSAHKVEPITHLNDNVQSGWGKAESITWTDESYTVQGFLIYPANYDPAKKYPAVVLVHGGPASAETSRWLGAGFGAAPLSAAGYFVLMPNPRGSYGQGEKFTAANRKDFGYGDLRDILAGLDTIEAKFPIDPDRVGITGWSYGGFMTMFAVTQTQRFKAAVAGAGLSNWQSYYGENSIDQWMLPYFGASVYDDPAVYARSSAINFIKNVKTPTLVVVGDRDGECPAPQSFEFWHALRAEHVPTELVVYPNEGHGFVSKEHILDVLERQVAWFDQYMPANASANQQASSRQH